MKSTFLRGKAPFEASVSQVAFKQLFFDHQGFSTRSSIEIEKMEEEKYNIPIDEEG